MQNQKSSVAFNREQAASYDKKRAKLAPLNDALHLLIRMVLSELPANARILCVGVGTGAELIYLAKAFPEWRFTAVDPAAPMLDICRQQVEKRGIASQCTFHEGYLDSLPESGFFDAATCILVSHFLMELEDRFNFFRKIALRLGPGGYLVNSDLSADMTDSFHKSLFEIWIRTLKHSGLPEDRTVYNRDIAVLPPQKIESIIEKSGFDAPILFSQALLLHTWYARRTS